MPETVATVETALHDVLTHLSAARAALDGQPLAADVDEAILTLHEIAELPETTTEGTEEPHAALTAAESALDAIPLPDRPLWLLPLRAELAILRRRSTS